MKRSTGKLRLLAVLAVAAVAAIAVGRAAADTYNSPANITTTGANTLNWDPKRQGTSGDRLNTTQCGPAADDFVTTPNNYLLFVFTFGNTNLGAPAPVLHLGGTGSGDYAVTKASGGEIKFVTPSFPLAGLTANVTFGITGFNSDKNFVLTISHGCLAQTLPDNTALRTAIVGGNAADAAPADATVHDTATLLNLTANNGVPQGTVAFAWYTNATCSGTGADAGSAPLGANGVADGSNSFGPLLPGEYSFSAHYISSDPTKWSDAYAGCEPLQVKAPPAVDLSAGKDATTSFTRAYQWTITKSVDKSEVDMAVGGTATFNYIVHVEKSAPVDTGWQVSGTITLNNPGDRAVSGVTVTDALPGGTCTVTGGSNATVGTGIASFPYSCTFALAPPATQQTNTATITWGDQSLQSGFVWLHGGTLSPSAPVDWSTPSTTTGDSISVTDSLGGGFGPTSSSADFTYSRSFAGVAGACTTYDNTATIDQTGQFDSKTVKVCVGKDLTVSKTATPSFTRTYTWGIDKSVDNSRLAIAAGGTATSNYKVNVTHDAGTDSAWQVAGEITVSNPNHWEAISLTGVLDQIDNGGSCSITSGDPTGSIAADTSVKLGYVCSYAHAPSPAAFTNTATASWDKTAASSPTGSASGTKSAAFGDPTTIVDGSVSVSDTARNALGAVSYTDPSPTTFSYSVDRQGVAGTCTDYPNTASFIANTSGATGSAKADVVVCVGSDLTVSKTATPSFTRTYTWGIKKSVDNSRLAIAAGGTATSKYTVDVTHGTGTDSAWKVAGDITVTNPNDWEPITLTGISDALDQGGSCSITEQGPYVVPKSGTLTLHYTCTSDGSSVKNTATATWDAGAAATPDGSAAGNATVAFTTPTTIVDGSVSVSDSVQGALGTVSYTDASPKTISYSIDRHGVAGTCTDYPNTASFTANTSGATGSSSADVVVCVGSDLTVAKTATPSFTKTYAWGIAKSVDKTSVKLIGGGSATFNYAVAVTHDAGTASSWAVAGAITVTNPNDWEAITLTGISDALDQGGSCSLTEQGAYVVPKSGTLTLHYTCTSDGSSVKNTATATWDAGAAATPDGSAAGNATFAFTNPTTIVDGSVTVTDSVTGPLGTVSYSDASPKSFTYARVIPAPAAGTCPSYGNTAKFVANTTGTAGSSSQTVTVCDYNAALTPGYWKNHLNVAKFSQTLGSFTVGNASIATSVFNGMNCSSTSAQDAIGCLAGHLLATKFNLANQSDICIAPVVAKADAFLKAQAADGVVGINYVGPAGTYALSAAQRSEAITLKSALDAYNNGAVC